MALPIYRLRRWLAVIAAVFTVVVGGMYFYARMRQRNVLKEFPNKMGYDISRKATGFQLSKSDARRTLFTIQASDVKEFKLNGRAELHHVNIVLYGRDSSRFDQIYGDDFAYDPKSGDVTAKGDVQIDLEANPAGITSADQATPKELKNPIHLRTRDLVFNRDTGNAATAERVEFRTAQASGWAVGVQYVGRANTLTLRSQVHILLTGGSAAEIDAARGVITSEPRQIVLDHPRMERNGSTVQSDQATFFLAPDNSVERVLAIGNVHGEMGSEAGRARTSVASQPKTAASAAEYGDSALAEQSSRIEARADQAEFLLAGTQNQLRTATLTGNVQVERVGFQPMQGRAGRVILDLAGANLLQKVHAAEGVRLWQRGASVERAQAGNSTPQDVELSASIVDFFVTNGRLLDHAETSGDTQITISPGPSSAVGPAPSQQKTVVTAGKFNAKFDQAAGRSRLASIHGAPDARIVNMNPGQPDRVSTSEMIDATFLPQGGIESITQQGRVTYSDGLAPEKRTQAWAERARYTPADQMLVLTGSARVAGADMATTATIIKINRATGDALAEGDVKSTYSELKEQPDGALLASSSPIHVTARTMTAHKTPSVALYTGNARLWQDANVIEAPSIEFDRERRFVTAQGTASQPVSTIVVQPEKPESAAVREANRKENHEKPSQSSPIAITGSRLTYADAERKAHYEGGVVAKGADFTATAKTMDVYLLPRGQVSNNESFGGTGQLDRMVAQGNVVIQEPKRRAEGQMLTYFAAGDKFVLTGGPPSIFDAEQGKITGVSLTFFRRDDRVLVEGAASTPVVTQTRVAPKMAR